MEEEALFVGFTVVLILNVVLTAYQSWIIHKLLK